MRVRIAIVALLCVCVLSSTLRSEFVGGRIARAAEPPVIRETPPAPVVKDDERVAELRARREHVAGKIGPNSVLIMFSGEPRVYTNDVDYEFRQENNLYYLTNLKQEGATLVILPGNTNGAHEILFLPRRNPAAETWTGHMYSPEEARQISGVNEIWEAKEFEPFMRALRTRRAYRPQPDAVLLSNALVQVAPSWLDALFAAMAQNEATLYLLLPGGENSREYRQEQEFASTWAKTAAGLNVRTAWAIFAEMRMRKSPYELRMMQHAVDISIEGHERAQAVASRAQWEYEVEAELDYTFKRRNADNWGYPNIVGCGPNATTLHYEESQGRVHQGDLLLMDAGAEYEHYSADVTRTFPVSGKFNPAQAEIYNIVLAAQEAGFRAIRPGAQLPDVHNAALEVVKDGLFRLGLITDKSGEQYRVWFMHGTSHYLGMNVHDVNVRGAKLDAGMVFTVEPGIYIRPDALDYLPKTPENEKFIAAVRPAFEKYKGIGVRIEDDVVVTADGYRNLSAALPRTIPDIESFIARAQKEVRAGTTRPGGPHVHNLSARLYLLGEVP
ncbi:MAG: Xaa-Pro aminopeptidase [Acidobacteriota bacterium]|nr:Xaa-Pro aminopeptidase [Acidobacteriota bacterium]